MKKNRKFRNKKKLTVKISLILRKFYRRFIKIQDEPRKIAFGFALGLFIGLSPAIGFHTIIAVFFAALFSWNKISAAIGVWISNPVTAPILYSVTYLLGLNLLGHEKHPGSPSGLVIHSFTALFQRAPETLWAMILGGIIIGLPIAVIGYLFAFSAVKGYQEKIKLRLARHREKPDKKKKRMDADLNP